VETHFVHCLRSNHENKPDMIDRELLLEQLNGQGLSATLMERSHGLSYGIK